MGKCRPASKPNTILLVDDEQDILDILVRVLRTAGYDTDTASNGQEALRKVSGQDYDLIITNVRMPILDGRAFYRQLCTFHSHLSQRVVFCTGDIADLATQRFLSATGVPVIFKPFPLSTVLEVVSWKLALRRAPLQTPPLPLRRPETVIVPAS